MSEWEAQAEVMRRYKEAKAREWDAFEVSDWYRAYETGIVERVVEHWCGEYAAGRLDVETLELRLEATLRRGVS